MILFIPNIYMTHKATINYKQRPFFSFFLQETPCKIAYRIEYGQ